MTVLCFVFRGACTCKNGRERVAWGQFLDVVGELLSLLVSRWWLYGPVLLLSTQFYFSSHIFTTILPNNGCADWVRTLSHGKRRLVCICKKNPFPELTWLKVAWLQLEGLIKSQSVCVSYLCLTQQTYQSFNVPSVSNRMQKTQVADCARGKDKTGLRWRQRRSGRRAAARTLLLNCLELKALLWGCVCLCLQRQIYPVILATRWSLIVTTQTKINK